MAEMTVELERAMIKNIRENLKDMKFGSYGVMLRVHEQTIVDVTYTKTASQREHIQVISEGEANG